MNEQEFQELLKQIPTLDAFQMERLLRALSEQFIENEEIIGNMDARSIGNKLRFAADLVQQRTGE